MEKVFREYYASFLLDLTRDNDQDYIIMHDMLLKWISKNPYLAVFAENKFSTSTGKQINLFRIAYKMEELNFIQTKDYNCSILKDIISNENEKQKDLNINIKTRISKKLREAKIFDHNELKKLASQKVKPKEEPISGPIMESDSKTKSPIIIVNINTPWEMPGTGIDKQLFDYVSEEYSNFKEITKKNFPYKDNNRSDWKQHEKCFEELKKDAEKYNYAFVINIAYSAVNQGKFLMGDSKMECFEQRTISQYLELIRQNFHKNIFMLHLTQDPPEAVKNAITFDPENNEDSYICIGKDMSFIHVDSKSVWKDNFAYFLLAKLPNIESHDIYTEILDFAKEFENKKLGEIRKHLNLTTPMSFAEKESDLQKDNIKAPTTDLVHLPYYYSTKGFIVHLDLRSKDGKSSKELGYLIGFLKSEIEPMWDTYWVEAILDVDSRCIKPKSNNYSAKVKENGGYNSIFVMLGDRIDNCEQKWLELDPNWCLKFVQHFNQSLPNFTQNFLKVFILSSPDGKSKLKPIDISELPPNTIIIILPTNNSDIFYNKLRFAFHMNWFQKTFQFNDWLSMNTEIFKYLDLKINIEKPVFLTTSKK